MMNRSVQTPGLLVFQFVVSGVLWGAMLLMWSTRPLVLRQLRLVEAMVFGLSTVCVAAGQYTQISVSVEQAGSVVAPIQTHLVTPYFFVILIYGMFVPNTWRRATAAVALMAAAPLVVVGLLLTRPVVWRQVVSVTSLTELSAMGIQLLIGACCAVYGTHVINRLQAEAFEAKRFGQYQLRTLIGKGGMGEVYLAEHVLLKRPCAIKLIRPERTGRADVLARFEREANATAKLSHPNTIEIYDYGHTDDGTFYYVMEFLPGLSLAELIQRFGPMPPERAIHLLRQTCNALGEAHAAGLIHRDIKPGNIFAAQRGGVYDVAKLLDFGLVKPVADVQAVQLTQMGTIAGSLLYISPEQALGDPTPTERSDIYSMGAVAYRLLTGQPPFQGNTASRLVVAHARDPVMPPSKLEPNVPGDLEQVVLRCLQKDPDKRYQDAASLEADLGACQDAGKWTQQRAAAWWAEVGQAAPPADAPNPEPHTEQA